MNEYVQNMLLEDTYRETMTAVVIAFSAIIAIISWTNGNPLGASFVGAMLYLLTCVLVGTVIRVVGQ